MRVLLIKDDAALGATRRRRLSPRDADMTPRAPRSLRWRLGLGLGLAAGLTIVWLAAIRAAALTMRHEIEKVFDSALSEMAQRVLTLTATDLMSRDAMAKPVRVALLRGDAQYLIYVVRDAEGRLLLRSHDADPAVFPPVTGRGFVDTPTLRVYFDEALNGAGGRAADGRRARAAARLREAITARDAGDLSPVAAPDLPGDLTLRRHAIWSRSSPPRLAAQPRTAASPE